MNGSDMTSAMHGSANRASSSNTKEPYLGTLIFLIAQASLTEYNKAVVQQIFCETSSITETEPGLPSSPWQQTPTSTCKSTMISVPPDFELRMIYTKY